MKGDFSRDTFDRTKGYAGVMLQQGSVVLDADWNEQAAIRQQDLRTLVVDLFGPVLPIGEAFAITPVGRDLVIGPGNLYVNGIRCTNSAKTRYRQQDPAAVLPPMPRSRPLLVYLEAWERVVTPYQDPDLRDPALEGLLMSVRVQVTWRVRVHPLRRVGDCAPNSAAWSKLREAWQPSTRARLTASTSSAPGSHGNGSYTGNENRLYRIEVHASSDRPRELTLKWARANASTVVPVVAVEGTIATVAATAAHVLEAGDWVEVSDDVRERDGRAGVLARVAATDVQAAKVTLEPAAPLDPLNPATHPLLRRWDHGRAATADLLVNGALPTQPGQPLTLEDGITVTIGSGALRAGDYWLVPARSATADIDWPRREGVPAALPPRGVYRHLVPLAVLTDRGELVDCLGSLRHHP